MNKIKLLLVDDEDDFRGATRRVLERRGFVVTDVESGERALAVLRQQSVDIVILDLKMGGMDGIATLKALRKVSADLPVIILTGQGSYEDAVAGIHLDIVDFLQKPVDIEKLAVRVRRLLSHRRVAPLREATVADLMVPASSYGRVHLDDPIVVAIGELQRAFLHPVTGKVAEQGHRSVLVFDRQDRFRGLLRISDVLRLVVPAFLRDSPYASFFTGMFLAQCKTVGQHRVADLQRFEAHIQIGTPLMEAAHLMASQAMINLPVMDGNDLVGVLRDKDLLLEIARHHETA